MIWASKDEKNRNMQREAGLGGGVSMTLLCKGNNKETSREEMLHSGDSEIRLWIGF